MFIYVCIVLSGVQYLCGSFNLCLMSLKCFQIRQIWIFSPFFNMTAEVLIEHEINMDLFISLESFIHVISKDNPALGILFVSLSPLGFVFLGGL